MLLCSAALLYAERPEQLRPSNYVNDFAHVLDAATQSRLNEECRQIDQRAHAQIAVVTVNSLEGDSIEDFGNRLFAQWGIGGKKTDRGVLVLLAVQDRRYRVEVGYGLESILNDAKVGTFGREMVPKLRAADYSGAISVLTGRIADVIAQDAKIEPVSGLPAARAPDQPATDAPMWPFVLGFVVLLLILGTRPGRSLLWLLLVSGNRGYRGGGWGGGNWGGGGWGGGSSGGDSGGFGGFGGGSSGGGGASGSW